MQATPGPFSNPPTVTFLLPEIVHLTYDHKPSDSAEAHRVREKGGFIDH